MKLLLTLSLFSLSIACMAETTASKKTLPISKPEKLVKADQAKTKTDPKAKEDCKDKAKQTVKIEETISLSGNTGCSIDEAKP